MNWLLAITVFGWIGGIVSLGFGVGALLASFAADEHNGRWYAAGVFLVLFAIALVALARAAA
jgi:sugar phosphate permease